MVEHSFLSVVNNNDSQQAPAQPEPMEIDSGNPVPIVGTTPATDATTQQTTSDTTANAMPSPESLQPYPSVPSNVTPNATYYPSAEGNQNNSAQQEDEDEEDEEEDEDEDEDTDDGYESTDSEGESPGQSSMFSQLLLYLSLTEYHHLQIQLPNQLTLHKCCQLQQHCQVKQYVFHHLADPVALGGGFTTTTILPGGQVQVSTTIPGIGTTVLTTQQPNDAQQPPQQQSTPESQQSSQQSSLQKDETTSAVSQPSVVAPIGTLQPQ